MDYNEFGRRLRNIRVAAGLTKKEAAAKLGLTDKWLDHVEHGRRKVSFEKLEPLVAALGRRFAYDLVPADAKSDPVWLTEEETRELAALRALSGPDRARASAFVALLPGARPDAPEAVLATLRLLQVPAAKPEAVAPMRALGDPDE